MEAFLQSFFLVTLSEIGDKSQILAFVLASRFKRPWVILAGILVGVALNHLLAIWAGNWASEAIPQIYLKWVLVVILLVCAVWTLLPGQEEAKVSSKGHFGVFLTTVSTYFLAEMGDKTQITTGILAAQYHNTLLVLLGSTLGVLIPDALAIFFGERVRQVVPMKWIRIMAAIALVGFALLVLWEQQ